MIWQNRGAIFTLCLWGRCGGYPPQRGKWKSRRLWSVGETSPLFCGILSSQSFEQQAVTCLLPKFDFLGYSQEIRKDMGF
jgi:hypothetical protein